MEDQEAWDFSLVVGIEAGLGLLRAAQFQAILDHEYCRLRREILLCDGGVEAIRDGVLLGRAFCGGRDAIAVQRVFSDGHWASLLASAFVQEAR